MSYKEKRVISGLSQAIFWVGGWAVHPSVTPLKTKEELMSSTAKSAFVIESYVIARETV